MLRWAGGIGLSVAAHIAAGALLVIAMVPEPVEPPDELSVEMRMEAANVRESRATETEADAPQAAEQAGVGDRVGTSAVRSGRAEPLDGASIASAVTEGLVQAEPTAPVTPLSETGAAIGAPAEPLAEADASPAAIGPDEVSAEAARASAPEPARLAAGPVPQSQPVAAASAEAERSRPVAAPSETARAEVPEPTAAASLGVSSAAATSLAPDLGRAAGVSLPSAPALSAAERAGTRVAGSEPASQSLAAAAAASEPAVAATADARPIGAAQPRAPQIGAARPQGRKLATAAAKSTPAPARPAAAAPTPAAAPDLQVAAAKAPEPERAAAPSPRGRVAPPREARGTAPRRFAAASLATRPPGRPPRDLAVIARAGLAWSGGAGAAFDAVSLATVQSFMAPRRTRDSAAHTGDVRDGISSFLAGFGCSRLQAAFVPETGALEIRGHVPENAMRGAVEAELQGMIGEAIPVGNDLAVLPAPQCSVLSGIEALGLPQSTDQVDDPLVVGQAAQARTFAIAGGSQLQLDLGGADYPAYVYVDYFDGAGNVLHLIPNPYVPLREIAAEAPLRIGAGNPDFENLALTVEPPYGRDIAVAFASSEPLYEGLRPVVEPAEEYLAWLRDRVAEASQSPDYRGEWVYFFVDTFDPQ